MLLLLLQRSGWCLLVSGGIPANHQVFGLLVTHVDVAVVFRHEVDVVEDETVPAVVLQRLQVSDVQQLCPVERCIASLHVKDKRGTSLWCCFLLVNVADDLSTTCWMT